MDRHGISLLSEVINIFNFHEVDKGLAKSLTTTTAKEDIYAFFFDQKGLMAGAGLQGAKITKINPDQ